MSTLRPFRFGVVAAQAGSGEEWVAVARHAEELGFSTMLVPDTLGRTLAPLTAIACAAAPTRRLRVGTYVLVNDFRHPVLLAREAATLDLLSGGRMELGLGVGRPNAAADYATLGLTFDRGGARVDRLAAALPIIKAQLEREGFPRPVQDPRPPILIAAGGRRMLALAAEHADIVALAARPDEPEVALAERVAQLREAAPQRFDSLELNVNLAAVGAELAPQALAYLQMDLEELVRVGSSVLLLGSPAEMCEELMRRREALGVSYFTVPASSMEVFAPVVEALAGR
ncbi:MAG: Luciferase-like monooxygenase [Chloroflexi bacterium]|jgi:probable F420-dependent oxidoreductase|nr:Luciferase-like monooxygenase [Chloroflexota bacterium]